MFSGTVQTVARRIHVDHHLRTRILLVLVSQTIHLFLVDNESAKWISYALYAMLAISAVQLCSHLLRYYKVVVKCSDGICRVFRMETPAFQEGQKVYIAYSKQTGLTIRPA